MNDYIRSLYIRVLRGKCDRGRGNPKYMRNISAEMEWFYNFGKIKSAFNKDKDCPEEIIMYWSSSRMPKGYKWAKRYVINRPEAASDELKREYERDLFMEKSTEKTLMRKIGAWMDHISKKNKV